MTPWQKLANELMTDPALKDISEEQIEAVVDVLLLTMYADKKVAFMEQAELEHMLDELPWIKDKEEKMEAYLRRATDRIRALEGAEAVRAVAAASAAKLDDVGVRAKVYEMCKTLAGADMEVSAEEREVLGWLAECFEIDGEACNGTT